VAEAGAQLAQTQGDVEKFEPLAKIAAISRRDLDTAVAERDAAQQRVEAAKDRVDAARGSVKAAEGQVAAAKAQLQSTKIQLGYTKVYAPLSGLIGKTQAYVGDLVGRAPLVDLNAISQLDPIHVEFSVSEREYLDLQRRRAAAHRERERESNLEMILADGMVYSEKGSINFADRQVDPATGTLLLQASFPNPKKLIRPGQFARVRGLVETKNGALLVPQRAAQELQGQYQLYVVGPDDTAQIRSVTLGERVGSLWLVEKGLEPGERVIVEGLQRVRPGAAVSPREVPPPAAPAEAGGDESPAAERR
jgi:membrane fusion protein (multidrug efflux system)